MQIDDGSEKRIPEMESLTTTGGLPAYPPTPEMIQAYGPVAEVPLTPLDMLPSTEEANEGGRAVSPLVLSLRRLRRDKRALVSVVFIIFVVLFSYAGPPIYEHVGPVISGGLTHNTQMGPAIYHSYNATDLINEDATPSGIIHPLGQDQLGRDILARLMAGSSVSIEVAALVEIFDISLGILFGVLAGYYGGLVDTFLARFTDIMFAFPGLLFAILAAATLGSTFSDHFGFAGRLILVSLAIGIVVWPQMARLVRGQTLQLKEQQFIEAARLSGSSDRSIIMSHIIPNLADIVIVFAALDVVGTIVGEATLSLLGLGVQPPGSSLGLMINDAQFQITVNPWEIIWPCLLLALLVLAFSFLGDGIRDAFDPRGQA